MKEKAKWRKQQEGYDVLRLIEHGNICYVSSEYMTGMPLIYWLKEQPCVTKDEIYSWVQSLIKQLILIHKCRGNPGYRYVNPYCILVTENGALYYLDMDAKSNADLSKQMQSRNIREHFLPPDYQNYRINKEKIDIYGLGKTLQYILAVVLIEPGLSRREETRFQKIISKCLKQHKKTSFQRISDIQKYIPKYNTKKHELQIQKKHIAIITLTACIVSGTAVYRLSRESGTQNTVDVENGSVNYGADHVKGKTSEEAENQDAVSGYRRLALLYFLELKQPDEALEYLGECADDKLSENLRFVIRIMEMPKKGDAESLKEYLRAIEEEIPQEDSIYYWFLIKGYDFMQYQFEEDEAEEILRLGQAYLDRADSQTDETGRSEVEELMAGAYENTGERKLAIQCYENILENTEEMERKEGLYKKLSLLYEEDEQPDKALETCARGIGECTESVELRNLHIKMLCADRTIERELCSQTIKEYLTQIPELKDNEEFKKLQTEYGIKVEGEKVWIEE